MRNVFWLLTMSLACMASACDRGAVSNTAIPSNAEHAPTLASGNAPEPIGWLTFTNPQGLYSISYPKDLGGLTVEYSNEGALLSFKQLDGTFSLAINWFDNIWGDGKSFERLTFDEWLARRDLSTSTPPAEIITIDGLHGYMFPELTEGMGSPAGPGDITVFLMREPPPILTTRPYIYEINVECGGVPNCASPQFWFWRQMLNSFRQEPAIVDY